TDHFFVRGEHSTSAGEQIRISFTVSGRNSAPSLVSVGGIVPHHWCQWEE
ncbi:unnamed protein product, partial [Staurois parvus]